MRKVELIGLIISFIVVSGFASITSELNLKNGWQLKGTDGGFMSMDKFNQECIETVWVYDDTLNKWRAYSPKDEIRNLLEDNSNIELLENIPPDSGFWVFADYNCSVNKDILPYINYVSDSIWDKTKDFTLDMLANKTFNYFIDWFKHEYNFDENGIVTNVVETELIDSFENYLYSTNSTYDVNISYSNGEIIKNTIYSYFNCHDNTTTVRKSDIDMKYLEYDEDLGFVVLNRRYTIDSYYEWIGVMIKDGVSEAPVDMQGKIPYEYYLYGRDATEHNRYMFRKIEFNSDGKTNFLPHYPYYSSKDSNFTIEDGKIVMSEIEDTQGYFSSDIAKIQVVYSFENFDILKIEGESIHKSSQISFKDDEEGWKTVDLNDTIQKWNDFFELTGNKLDMLSFNQEEKTFVLDDECNMKQGSFEIINNGKTLKLCSDDDSVCGTYELENGMITYPISKSTNYIVAFKNYY